MQGREYKRVPRDGYDICDWFKGERSTGLVSYKLLMEPLRSRQSRCKKAREKLLEEIIVRR